MEVSAFLTANVPPKPQHSSAWGNSTRSIPPTFRSNFSGAFPDAQHPQGVAGRVERNAVRIICPDILHPEFLYQKFREFENFWCEG